MAEAPQAVPAMEEAWQTSARVLGECKVAAALGSAALAGLGCWAARHLQQLDSNGGQTKEKLLMLGNTMAAGILLAAGLVHMLPDASKALEGLCEFPLASVIAGGAFSFLVVLGEVAGGCTPQRNEPHSHTDCVAYEAKFALWPHMELMPPHGCEEAGGSGAAAAQPQSAQPQSQPQSGRATSGSDSPVCEVIFEGASAGLSNGRGGHASCHSHAHVHEEEHEATGAAHAGTAAGGPQPLTLTEPHVASLPLVLSLAATLPAASAPQRHSCHSHSACCRVHRHSDAPCMTQAPPTTGPALSPPAGGASRVPGLEQPLLVAKVLAQVEEAPGYYPGAEATAHPLQQHSGDHISRCHVRVVGGGPIAEVKSFLLFFALCFHSVMEGLGMGSARDAGLLLSVIVAILAHKGLAAFALGSSLTQADLPAWKFWTFVLIFSSGTPLGCAMGALPAGLAGAASQSIMNGVCIALASGTFLQVSSMELLPRALAEDKHKVLGELGLVLGFAAMSLLAIWC